MTTARNYTPTRTTGRPISPTLSFELFPPRPGKRDDQTWGQVGRLIDLAPDWVSVTYGAGGAHAQSRDTSVRVLATVLRERPDLPVVAHLTAMAPSRYDLALTIRLLLLAGVRNFLAIRGDGNDEDAVFPHSDGLVALIREIAADVLPDGCGTGPGGSGVDTAKTPDDYVSVAVAAYPASSGVERLREVAALRAKRDAGADYAITQVFYEADDYASLTDDCRRAGVTLPIIPGIIPLTSAARLRRLETVTGVSVPGRIHDCLSEPDPSRRYRASLRHTMRLIHDVLAAGAPGIHLYTFNRCRPAFDIAYALRAHGYLAESRRPGRPSRCDTELARLALTQLTPTS